MSENHIDRFFKRNKLKPRKLDVNFLEVSNQELNTNNNGSKLSTVVSSKLLK